MLVAMAMLLLRYYIEVFGAESIFSLRAGPRFHSEGPHAPKTGNQVADPSPRPSAEYSSRVVHSSVRTQASCPASNAISPACMSRHIVITRLDSARFPVVRKMGRLHSAIPRLVRVSTDEAGSSTNTDVSRAGQRLAS